MRTFSCASARGVCWALLALALSCADAGAQCPWPMGCWVEVDNPNPVVCIHGQPECATFTAECTDCCAWCLPPDLSPFCVTAGVLGSYSTLRPYSYQCGSGCCIPGSAWTQIVIFGGEYVAERCRRDDPDYCEPLPNCTYLCPDWLAKYIPIPDTSAAALADYYTFEYQIWCWDSPDDVPHCPPGGAVCDPRWSPACAKPDDCLYLDEIGPPDSPGKVHTYSAPGLYRTRTLALREGGICRTGWHYVVVTDWQQGWPDPPGQQKSADVVIPVGEERTLGMLMEPWYLDERTATLTGDNFDALDMFYNAQLVDGTITWPSPHSSGVVIPAPPPPGQPTPPPPPPVGPLADWDWSWWQPQRLDFNVRGVAPGICNWNLTYEGCTLSWKATVIQADIDAVCGPDEQHEAEGVGMLVGLNNDDDNGNGIPDNEEGTWPMVVIAVDDDLVEIHLSCLPPLPGGEVRLSLAGPDPDDPAIRVYRDRHKHTLVPLTGGGSTWPVSEMADYATLYVEGIRVVAIDPNQGRPCAATLSLHYTYRAMTHSDELNVTVLSASISELGFTQDHMITIWPGGGKIDDPDGSEPVWKSGGSPNLPVCYTKSTSPTMFGVFSATDGVTLDNVSLRAKARDEQGNWVVVGQADNLLWENGIIQDKGNSDGDVDDIAGGAPIPKSDRVIFLDPTLTWEVKPTACNAWVPAATSGPLKMYFTWSTPLESDLYDLALDKAVRQYCGTDGKTPATDVSAAIRTGIHGDLGSRYAPDGAWYSGNDVLRVYQTSDSLICGTYANVTAYLNRSVGLSASTEWVWAGTSSQGYRWLYTSSMGLGTILVDPGSNLWDWHAVASTPEGRSDAALNVTGVNVVHKDPRGNTQYRDAGASMTTGPPIVYVIVSPPHSWP